MNRLAVIAPNLGAWSETFIRRHMCDLLPGRTVVAALTDDPPNCGHWNVDGPAFVINRYYRDIRLPARASRFLRRVTGIRGRNHHSALKKFLKNQDVSAILGEYLDCSVRYLEIADEMNLPLYAHAHGLDVSARLDDETWRREYLKLNTSAGIITMSAYSKCRLVDVGIDAGKIHVIPYGIPVTDRSTLARRDAETTNGTVRCLAVGRMVAKKGPILLLDSFRRAAEKNRHLVLDYVGDGELFPAVRQYVKAFDLEERVHFRGILPNDKVLELMQKADIFVQHSVTCPDSGDQEGLPVAILEAMGQALPVISTQHAGIPEAVEQNETGVLVPENETEMMAEAILALADDHELRQRLGVAGRNRVEIRYSWAREREALLSLLMPN